MLCSEHLIIVYNALCMIYNYVNQNTSYVFFKGRYFCVLILFYFISNFKLFLDSMNICVVFIFNWKNLVWILKRSVNNTFNLEIHKKRLGTKARHHTGICEIPRSDPMHLGHGSLALARCSPSCNT